MNDHFFDHLEQFGSRKALTLPDGTSFSYTGLAGDADRFAARLRKRSLVFNFCDNNAESVIGYLGSLRARVPQALISPSTPEDLVRGLISKYRPYYLWAAGSLPFPGYNPVFTYGGYALWAAQDALSYPIHPELALLLTTSGSTGSPKFVRQSYTNIAANAASIAKYLDLSEIDRPITTLPMSYTYGLSIINSHLQVGSEILLNTCSIVDRGFWTSVHSMKASSFGGVPFTYEMLKKLKFAQMQLPQLKKLTQAGGRLSPELCREFADTCREKGIRFFVMYGQTEATARISYLDCSVDSDRIGSIGKAIPGGKLTLVDDRGGLVEGSGIPGEMVYRGPNVTLGYATTLEDLNLGDENGGTLFTGDIAQRDEAGFYYIVGRKKRFLKLFGSRVNLDEVETLLRASGWDAACSGRDDQLEIYTADAASQPQIKALLSGKLGINPKGFSLHLVSRVPRTESGKIEYGRLPEMMQPPRGVHHASPCP